MTDSEHARFDVFVLKPEAVDAPSLRGQGRGSRLFEAMRVAQQT
ncbi:hypothetical protein AB0H86_02510 [Streptomyces sp. NPDC050997]